MAIRRSLNLPGHCLQILHLAMQSGDLVFEAGYLDFGNIALLAVGPVQSSKIPRDAGIDLFNPRLDLVHGEVLITIVHSLELAAINGNNSSAEQAKSAA